MSVDPEPISDFEIHSIERCPVLTVDSQISVPKGKAGLFELLSILAHGKKTK